MHKLIVDKERTLQVRQECKDKARHYMELARKHRNFVGYHATMTLAHRNLQSARTFVAHKEVL